jgi:hypothetical protein
LGGDNVLIIDFVHMEKTDFKTAQRSQAEKILFFYLSAIISPSG